LLGNFLSLLVCYFFNCRQLFWLLLFLLGLLLCLSLGVFLLELFAKHVFEAFEWIVILFKFLELVNIALHHVFTDIAVAIDRLVINFFVESSALWFLEHFLAERQEGGVQDVTPESTH
jgi:hypothetical protein